MAYVPVIKICGVKTPEILDHVIAQRADMVGFNSFGKSPRYIDFATISGLVDRAANRIESVVLLVDPDDALVDAAVATGAGWLQLHGHETPERLADIKARTGKKMIKALPIGSSEDIAAIAPYAAIADGLILDAKPPKDATRPGGLGQVFDWTLLNALDPGIGFMLSGGLTVDNVAQAVSQIRPFGLDVASGVESERGVKDPALISRFIANAKAEI
ncbi:phosphoribosylanthranilate isomerase [Pelagibacterium lentulum]|uniref:N-(5'-phosphoribosyl)anthranilate isomerase n=1 Tax=Pelagibacterium lentulum TaxID=2029865 RepID=A0A916VVU4_9HYPH|nr:phosphoribosylanthranilate isomerase [Pelagibacterium lentulum]GGA42250.1 N-(5'-phosphoribosyl)anthranilate isomerase [Pelagibacterium lentulum]